MARKPVDCRHFLRSCTAARAFLRQQSTAQSQGWTGLSPGARRGPWGEWTGAVEVLDAAMSCPHMTAGPLTDAHPMPSHSFLNREALFLSSPNPKMQVQMAQQPPTGAARWPGPARVRRRRGWLWASLMPCTWAIERWRRGRRPSRGCRSWFPFRAWPRCWGGPPACRWWRPGTDRASCASGPRRWGPRPRTFSSPLPT